MKTTGSVQEKNGRFYFVVNLYDANGKRKIKWISTGLTVRGNKRKAESMLREVLLHYDETGELPTGRGGAYEKVDAKTAKPLPDDPLHLCILITAYYGLRRSEVLGLKWSSIDFERKSITINHKVTEQLVNGKYVPVVSDVMKNKTSCRTLPLIPAVEEELLKQKEKQQLYRKLFKKSYSTEYLDFVCTDQEGKLIRPNFVTEHFDWLLTKYGLKHIRFHDLRHSCASLMVMNGVSMKQVQEWLGHSTFSTTADIYAHLDYKSKQGSAGVIANLLGESKLPK